jgi:hypothetical protein
VVGAAANKRTAVDKLLIEIFQPFIVVVSRSLLSLSQSFLLFLSQACLLSTNVMLIGVELGEGTFVQLLKLPPQALGSFS